MRTMPLIRHGTAARATSSGLATTLAVLLLPPLLVPPASAAPAQSYPVPAGRTYTVHGHGYGHGRGMSQYGAYGAARRGLGYRSILRFYYPGTSWGTARGRIRVLLTADRSPDLVVGAAPGLVVHDLGSGATYRLPRLAGVTRWRLEPVGTRTAVEYLRRGWHRYRTGGRPTLGGEGQFGADRPLTLWTPAGHHDYRGGLRAAAPTRGSRTRDTVNVVALDDYVRGVVPAEMPPGWTLEAVKAQAVAARTYAAWSRARSSGRGWQVCDTSACQVYRGVDGEAGRSDAAVAATAARVLTYRGAAAFTQFSSSSGGWTARGSRPYLAARPDPYDAFAANPVHTWTLRLSAARIQRAFPAVGRLVRLVVTRRDRHGQWGGRVGTIVVDGRRRNVTVSGDRFRLALGLRSTWFVP